MCNLVTQHQRVLQRIAAQVQVPVFHADILSAVALVFDGEGRGDALVEDVDGVHLDFDVARIHLRVLALALQDFAGSLDDEFPSQRSGGFHQLGGGVGLHHQLRDAIAVAQVDEGHSSQFTGLLDPSGQRYLPAFVRNAEFPACVCTVHIDVVVFVVRNQSNRQKYKKYRDIILLGKYRDIILKGG